ncbi:hypothetical protein [Sphingosinicella sp. BN140058]|uniref:hypothetical protein n=1 Tax=Sphingosinicella sp. BN140058 TaxID=1892855 RepID=UPI0010112104|nr:hypothetical protein [Sphingosinicella sp. BN140058]QAY76973.1 hypothetical protein ETR14_11045 [Sphingosinicella sp. BN140058]
MKRILFLPLAALAGCTTQPAERAPAGASQADQAQLATELANYRQAGPPVSCVPTRTLRGNRSAGEAAIIFEGTGRRIWVNRPAAGCPALTSSRALRTKTTTSQLCRGDIVDVFDPVAGFQYGGCSLGDFTPYDRNPR